VVAKHDREDEDDRGDFLSGFEPKELAVFVIGALNLPLLNVSVLHSNFKLKAFIVDNPPFFNSRLDPKKIADDFHFNC
jgi:hypothetical protein